MPEDNINPDYAKNNLDAAIDNFIKEATSDVKDPEIIKSIMSSIRSNTYCTEFINKPSPTLYDGISIGLDIGFRFGLILETMDVHDMIQLLKGSNIV